MLVIRCFWPGPRLQALLLNTLQHDGLVVVAGLVTDQFPMLFVHEHLAQGNLDEWLHANTPNFLGASQKAPVTAEALVQICLTLAGTLDFLAGKGLVLRRLQAHSVLVGDGVFKLRPIGCLGEGTVYRHADQTPNELVRWMAPEVLEDDRYS